MSSLTVQNRVWRKIETSPWVVLIGGVLIALLLVTMAMSILMDPALSELATLTITLGATSIFSLAIGFYLYRRGWARSPSLSFTLILTYGWAAVLTLLNVWIMAKLMFVDDHDLTLAGILLIFAVVIATSFGVFVSASVTDNLRNLAHSARKLADGDLSARAQVIGQDEVAVVAQSFNDMAAKLELADQERKEIESLRRDLIAWTSHDLRTPLTTIRVMVEALNDGLVEEDENRQRYYRTIRSEVVAMNQLIDDLFELAQLEAGGDTFPMDEHNLSDLISDTLESFRLVAERQTIQLDGDVDPDIDPVIMNASKISRVLDNLVQNAIENTPKGGNIRLSAGRRSGSVEVSVRDSGAGIPEEDVMRVFEKFYRAEPARSRSSGGSGLGLAIAKGIVEAHGGSIQAENGKNGGAIVTFSLPAK
ncbi:MAG: HAMP domain-containing sensor histidine kinase [Anaerolineae bacterium]|nr:MAG: HAMP domain-containing sensor histidine kinase [Anaerolineae bacterium]